MIPFQFVRVSICNTSRFLPFQKLKSPSKGKRFKIVDEIKGKVKESVRKPDSFNKFEESVVCVSSQGNTLKGIKDPFSWQDSFSFILYGWILYG